MQISLNWLNELINIKQVPVNELVEKLTLGGFEVEEIIENTSFNEKSYSLEISSTANRPDSLSIQGLSREIAALLDSKVKILTYSEQEKINNLKLPNGSKQNTLSQPCSDFIGLTINHLNNLSSPIWLQQKLLYSGVKPENNLQDFQNYIRLETGYPIEFYNIDPILKETIASDFDLSLTTSKISQGFNSLDGKIYSLNPTNLVLKANEKILGLAGFMSSKECAISTNTKTFFVEGSIFKAAEIRKQTRTLGLRTKRSSCYEKSLKNTYLISSLYRLLSLLKINNPNLTCKLHTLSESITSTNLDIKLHYLSVKQVLGPIGKIEKNKNKYIEPDEVTQCLKRLNLKTTYNNENKSWTVTIPHIRHDDLTKDIDLIEEIGRIYGFNKFLTRVPKINRIGYEDDHSQVRKKLTTSLLGLGLNELIQYSLVPSMPVVVDELQLINPLTSEYSNLRSTLLPKLLLTVSENFKNDNTNFSGFEYGHIFSSNKQENIIEYEVIAGILNNNNRRNSWSDKQIPLTWFEAKGQIEYLFATLNIPVMWKKYNTNMTKNIYHPYRTSQVDLANGKCLGTFGQINPFFATELNIPSNLYLFEFNFELIETSVRQVQLVNFTLYSTYPKIIKDLSFVIHQDFTFSEIKQILILNGSKFLRSVKLLDEYLNPRVLRNNKNLCLQLIFQSNSKTLQNKQVEVIIKHLENVLTTNFQATIRR